MDLRVIYQGQEFEIRPLQVEEAPLLLDAVRSSLVEIGRWESWCVESYSLNDATSFLRSVEQQWNNDTAFDCNVVSRSSGLVVG
ncbi:MAG: N-acetyltransferase, partial [Proteobacteria bacterium]|nr:N-acetyltransferase [Pseudomonadota bacterium]